jgi:hypothetical protein
MKKVLCTSIFFAAAYMLMAQQSGNPGEFLTEIRQVNQQQVIAITGYRGSSPQIRIPDQINGYPVAVIGNNAFRSQRIESVSLPATLVSIGDYAFYDNKLSSISIPPGVTTIGIGAFDNNFINGNAGGAPAARYTSSTPAAGGATYVRTFTIEPARSDTVFVQRANAQPSPAQQPNANIVVVPGYNPIVPQSKTGIVTVHQEIRGSGGKTTTPPTYINNGNNGPGTYSAAPNAPAVYNNNAGTYSSDSGAPGTPAAPYTNNTGAYSNDPAAPAAYNNAGTYSGDSGAPGAPAAPYANNTGAYPNDPAAPGAPYNTAPTANAAPAAPPAATAAVPANNVFSPAQTANTSAANNGQLQLVPEENLQGPSTGQLRQTRALPTGPGKVMIVPQSTVDLGTGVTETVTTPTTPTTTTTSAPPPPPPPGVKIQQAQVYPIWQTPRPR